MICSDIQCDWLNHWHDSVESSIWVWNWEWSHYGNQRTARRHRTKILLQFCVRIWHVFWFGSRLSFCYFFLLSYSFLLYKLFRFKKNGVNAFCLEIDLDISMRPQWQKHTSADLRLPYDFLNRSLPLEAKHLVLNTKKFENYVSDNFIFLDLKLYSTIINYNFQFDQLVSFSWPWPWWPLHDRNDSNQSGKKREWRGGWCSGSDKKLHFHRIHIPNPTNYCHWYHCHWTHLALWVD